MKSFNITNRVSAQAREEIERVINTHDTYRKSYFFTPCSNASGRRNNERKFEESNPSVSFKRGDEVIEVSMSYTESCRNVYYSLSVLSLKGEEKTIKNISYLKKIIKK